MRIGLKGNLGLSSDTRLLGNLLDFRTTLSAGVQDQLRPYLYDERSSHSTVHPYRLSDYSYRGGYSDIDSGLTLSPFASTSPFAASSLSYTIGGRLFSYSYSGLSGTGVDATPQSSSTWIGRNNTSLTTHAATATLGYSSPSQFSHRLTFQANLPPQLEKYSASYSLTRKFVNASLQGAFSRLSSSAALLPSSLTASLSLGGTPLPLLRSDMSWDFDALAPSSSVTSLEYLWAKTVFTARKAKGYSFASGLWNADGSNYFRPYEVSLAIGPRFSLSHGKLAVDGGTVGQAADTADKSGQTKTATETALSLQLNPRLSYTQNFVKFTDSALGAALDLTLTSKDGTSLSFSAASANKAAWRYWAALFPATSAFNPSVFYKNIFVDLGESFSIWDSSALKRSLFKLQNLSLTLSQDLHDWSLSGALSMSPLLYTPDSGRPYYQLDFSFSLAVTWKDIPELKTSLSYTQGAFGN